MQLAAILSAAAGVLAAACLAVHPGPAPAKRALDHDVYTVWRSIEGTTLSSGGRWIAYQLEPGDEGDGALLIHDLAGAARHTVARGRGARFDFGQTHAICSIAPERAAARQAELDEVEELERPKDALGIVALDSGQLERVERVSSFALPKEGAGSVAWLHFEPLPEKKEEGAQEGEEEEAQPQPSGAAGAEGPRKEKEKEKEKEKKKDDKQDGTELFLRELASGAQLSLAHVSEYAFSDDGRWLACATSTKDGSEDGLRVIDVAARRVIDVLAGEGRYRQLAFDESGSRLAFVSDRADVEADQPLWSLYLWNAGVEGARRVAAPGAAGLPQGWTVSPHRRPHFSDSGARLYFGSAPAPAPEPEELAADQQVALDVWSWTDDLVQPQQLKEREQELERSYLAVAHLDGDRRRLVQLGRPTLPEVQLSESGDAALALGLSDLPYRRARSWDVGIPSDLTVIDVARGDARLAREAQSGRIRLSPGGGFAWWWDADERDWFCLEALSGDVRNVSASVPQPLENLLHDTPSPPRAQGAGGWLRDDAGLLVYDEFDVWLLDPRGGDARCVTEGAGRAAQVRLRVLDLDPEQEALDPGQPLLLSAFDTRTKDGGFWRDRVEGDDAPRELVMMPRSFSAPTKATHAELLHFTRASFEEFPDVWVSGPELADARRVSDANPQQRQYLWGTAELCEWTSADGEQLRGILYKPEDFDPERKYPLIAYFYERMSDRLHRHHSPLPDRSTVRFPFYTSRGYLVFVPDIPYEAGFPGRSAVQAIVPGVLKLIDLGFVDPDAIGVQGHSWGGYQTAYLVTQTDLFSAAVGGAVVSNMTSAYGGVRWQSGMSRMFQYERSQSRIGATLWEAPQHYIDNSPLFFADDVRTPLLMMHNDQDGAVPWYQGIELFMALRRLDQPVWMLNYNGQGHGLSRYADKRDYAIRMQQFFDHYLLGAPAPRWMVAGLPAVEKGHTLGLELVEPARE